MSGNNAWLEPEELEQLQDELVAGSEHFHCLPLDAAHGFLAATAGVTGADPDDLLDQVLGNLAAEPGLRSLMMRFRDQLLHDLNGDDFGPLIMQMPREDGRTLPLPYGWCQGYARGLEFLGEDRRDHLLDDQEAGVFVVPILSFLMYEEAQWFEPPNETAHREAVAELGGAATALYRWWIAQG